MIIESKNIITFRIEIQHTHDNLAYILQFNVN